MTRVAAAAARSHPGIGVCPVLRTTGRARDSVGLSVHARQRNIEGRVRMTGPAPVGEIVVVDDIVTTGATATEAVRVLTAGELGLTSAIRSADRVRR